MGIRMKPQDMGARCDLCPLRGADPIGISKPPLGKVSLIVINEPIGRGEEKMRTPLAGRAGGMLKAVLEERAGIDMSSVYITPATLCRPEGDKEAKKAAECCAPRVLREVSGLPPAPLLILGKEALATILARKNILNCRGFIWEVAAKRLDALKALFRKVEKMPAGAKKETASLAAMTARLRRRLRGRPAVVSLAPSFVVKADVWAPIFRIDIARVGRVVRGEAKAEDEGSFAVWPGVRVGA